MTNEQLASIDARIRTKKARSWSLGWIGLALTVLPCFTGQLIFDFRFFLGFCALVIFGATRLAIGFGNASSFRRNLKCKNCGSTDTQLKDISTKYYDTTETKTIRTTYHNTDDEEIGHSETSYEAPSTGVTYVYKRTCNGCHSHFETTSGEDYTNLLAKERPKRNPVALAAAYTLMLLMFAGIIYWIFPTLGKAWMQWPLRHAAASRTAPHPTPPLSAESHVNLHGVGAIKLGMSPREGASAAGYELRMPQEGEARKGCYLAELVGGPKGINFIVVNGHIVRIDIYNPQFSTLSGAKVGMSEQDILTLYKGKLRSEPSTDFADVHYLVFTPTDSRDKDFLLTFESDGKEVASIRVGKLPGELPLVEALQGCP